MLGFFRNRTDHGTGEVRCHSMAENEKSKVEQNKIGHHFKMTSHQASLEQEGERRKDPSGMEPSFSSSPEDLLDNFLQQEFQSVWERTVKSRIITVDLYNALKDEPTLKQLLSFITRDEYEPSVPLLISSSKCFFQGHYQMTWYLLLSIGGNNLHERRSGEVCCQ